MMHRGVVSTKRHLVTEIRQPRGSRTYAIGIAACGRWDVTSQDPEHVMHGFCCKACITTISKSIERMARSRWPGYTLAAQIYEEATR